MSDLSKLWIEQEIGRQTDLCLATDKALAALKNQSTPYAEGMRRMVRIREALIEVLQTEQDKVSP